MICFYFKILAHQQGLLGSLSLAARREASALIENRVVGI